MNGHDSLAAQFEKNRGHLRGVAYRMLGSLSEADDAVQEAWLKLNRSESSEIENLGGWLTTVVARVCLDMLRARNARREDALDAQIPEPAARPDAVKPPLDPEQETMLAESVGLALLVVLNTLAPPERISFVLDDLFAVPSKRSPPSSAARPLRPVNSPAAHAGAFRALTPLLVPILPHNAKLSMPSSPLCAPATSARSSLCSIRTS